jgi:hypothetical protein
VRQQHAKLDNPAQAARREQISKSVGTHASAHNVAPMLPRVVHCDDTRAYGSELVERASWTEQWIASLLRSQLQHPMRIVPGDSRRRMQRYDMQQATCKQQCAACNMQHATPTCKQQCAACNMQHATPTCNTNMQHQHATCNTNMRRATCRRAMHW